MLAFAWPWTIAAIVLPLLVIRLMPRAPEVSGAALRIPFFAAVENLTPAPRGGSRRWRQMASAVAWILLVVAATRPLWIGAPISLPVSGRDLMLAVDLSGSMKREDMVINGHAVTRLEAVKKVAGDFIERRQGDRVGLILFGSRAYLQTPLTFDLKTVRTLLNESVIALAGEQTAIGDAIGLAVKRFRERDESNRILVLLTDGANTTGTIEPLHAARLAQSQALRIYTIGVGAEELLVKGLFSNSRVNPSADLDEETLQGIAAQTGGRFFRARNTDELEEIYTELDRIEPVESDEDVLRPTKELYPWPLSLALVLVVLIMSSHLLPAGSLSSVRQALAGKPGWRAN